MNINMYKNQRGIGLINVILTLFALGIGTIYGFQIGLGYLDKNIIHKTINSVLVEAKQHDHSQKTILTNINNRLSMNNIEINNGDIDVKDTGRGYIVQINYVKNIKINNDMSILMDFVIEGNTP